MAAPGSAYQSRDAGIAALLSSGTTTLEEIGAHYGLTRERVRQIAVREGVAVRKSAEADPCAIVAALRDPSCLSITAIAKQVHSAHASVRRVLGALGLLPAAARLFRLRKRAHKAAEIRRLVAAYQAERERLGRPLTAREAMRLSPPPQWVFGTNYIAKLRALAGEPVTRARQYLVGRRGALRGTILRLAATEGGCTVNAVAEALGTTPRSVATTIELLRKKGLVYTAVQRRGAAGCSVYRLTSLDPNRRRDG